MIATTAPAAILSPVRFARIVAALVAQFAGLVVGREWGFMVGEDFDMVAWVPRAGHLTLQLSPLDAEGDLLPAVRTVTVCPGVDRPWEVIGAGAVVIGETRGLDAAISLALDYVTAPARAGVQHDHDPFAV